VIEFNPDKAEEIATFDHHIILFDDRSEMGDKMKEVFMIAVAKLAVRDMDGKEPRNVGFIHWNPKDEESQKYLDWFNDFEETDFPDVVWRSKYRHGRFNFKLSKDSTFEEDAVRLSEIMDHATKGRV